MSSVVVPKAKPDEKIKQIYLGLHNLQHLHLAKFSFGKPVETRFFPKLKDRSKEKKIISLFAS
jgi:hypothetical protein